MRAPDEEERKLEDFRGMGDVEFTVLVSKYASDDPTSLLSFLVTNIRSLSDSQFTTVVLALGVGRIADSVAARVLPPSSPSGLLADGVQALAELSIGNVNVLFDLREFGHLRILLERVYSQI
jgi:hypothetical protein